MLKAAVIGVGAMGQDHVRLYNQMSDAQLVGVADANQEAGERGMFLVDHLTQDLYFYENAEMNGESWSAIRLLRGVSEGRMIRYPVRKYYCPQFVVTF